MYRIGIDVGGTNTDAVLINEKKEIIAEIKQPTTKDIYTGILNALKEVLHTANIDHDKITQAMLGTTQCTNAIVERKNLAECAVLRIAAPATVIVPPMVDWPKDLQKFVLKSEVIRGGYEYDGKEIAAFDEAAARSFFEAIKGKVNSVAIVSAFATVRNDHELKAKEICQEVMGSDVHISLSSEIGSMGIFERENATILNSMLYKVSESFTDGFAKSLVNENVNNATVYLSQNDGTLMTMEEARKYPILTIACGPTNSIRGASYLCDIKDAIVLDVGGTTSDIGVIQKGFPRESSIAETIGGVRTNFRMPDVVSFGLGGGSIIREHDGQITVGPDSVGYQITEKALVFGGDVLTATDIAVRLGMAQIGDPQKVVDIPEDFARKALQVITEEVENHVDEMKLSSDDVTLIVVGGGSIIAPEHLSGVSSVSRPPHFGVANAIGSAISKVSGTYDQLVSYDEIPREQALEAGKQAAKEMAVKAGAQAETVEIIDAEDVPLQYYQGNTNRVKIKAAGDL